MVKTSKFLSYVLRHKPEAIDLQMDAQGWVSVAELLEKAGGDGQDLTKEMLFEIVVNDDKQRYCFNSDKSRIRASQGHSTKVDLNLQPVNPPEYLYHGTASRNLDSIRERGLLKGQRHHVHLSLDETTARNVGSRYGKPVILLVESKRMVRDGFEFYQSENKVWLTDGVPPDYIQFPV